MAGELLEESPNGLAHWRQVTGAVVAKRIAIIAGTVTGTDRRPVQRFVRCHLHLSLGQCRRIRDRRFHLLQFHVPQAGL